MKSLNQRILLSATLVLMVFIVGIAISLERAFYDSAMLGVKDRLFARILLLMGDAEIDDKGILSMPSDLIDIDLSRPDSNIYAWIIDQSNQVAWKSTSALNKQIIPISSLKKGEKIFKKIAINDAPHFFYGFNVTWVTQKGAYPITFNVVTDSTLFDAQIERYREDLWGLLSIMALLFLVAQMLVLRWGLRPMRQVSTELAAIESGRQDNLTGIYPSELKLLTDSINSLIDHERKQQKRYRNGLADLAHSLKTPLAILSNAIGLKDKVLTTTLNEQLERMNNIVQYQLKRAATAGRSPGMRPIAVQPIAQKIINTIEKAYYYKKVVINNEIDTDIFLRIDEGDLMELLGNLIDNAMKWCQQSISLDAKQTENYVTISITDDGPGIQHQEVLKILERGVRADQSIPGHGIGLAIVRDIIEVYDGNLTIDDSLANGTHIIINFRLRQQSCGKKSPTSLNLL